MLAAGEQAPAQQADLVYLITLGDSAKTAGVKVLADIRSAGIRADTDYEGKSLKAAMRTANDLQARFVAILGDDELKDGVIALKDMSNGSQEKILMTGLVGRINELGRLRKMNDAL